MKTLDTVIGEGFSSPIFQCGDGRVTFLADMDIDVDGSGDSHGDPYFQPDTTLHYNGKPLNSDVDYFVVVPSQIRKLASGVVLGCLVRVTYNGHSVEAVVGDLGPTRKTGEASRAVAKALGIDPSPINGGVDDPVVFYEIFPGKEARIYGQAYPLVKAG